MSGTLGTYALNSYLPVLITTHHPSTGAAAAPSALTYSIYKAGDADGLLEDVDMTPASPFDSRVGLYYARVLLDPDDGFTAGDDYALVIAATVAGKVARTVQTFQIGAAGASAIKRNTALPHLPFFLVATADGKTPVELATPAVTLRLDDGDFADATNAAVEIGDGWYDVDLTAAELDAKTIAVNITANGCITRALTLITED